MIRPCRFLFFSLIIWYSCLNICYAATTHPQKLSASPLNVTNDGVTIRLLNARWAWPNSVGQPLDFTQRSQYAASNNMFLVISYEVLNRAKSKSKTLPAPQVFLWIHHRNVPGVAISSDNDNPLIHSELWANIDPYHPILSIHFRLLRSQALPGMNGHVLQTVTFPDIPVPTKNLKAVRINTTITTPNGTRVTVDKSIISASPFPFPSTGSPYLIIMGHWDQPALHPDASTTLSLSDWDSSSFRKPGVQDNLGRNLDKDWYDILLGTYDPLVHGNLIQNAFLVEVKSPTPAAKTLTLRMNLHERIPSLRNAAAFRYFIIRLKNDQITMPPLHPTPNQPLAAEPIGNGTLAVEKITRYPDYMTTLNWDMIVILTTPTPQTEKQSWLDTQDDFEANHNPLLSEGTGGPVQRIFWSAAGRLLPLNERGYLVRVQFTTQTGIPKPVTMGFLSSWKEVSRRTRVLSFGPIRIPKRGTVSIFDDPAPATPLSGFILRKVGYFDSSAPLLHGIDDQIRGFSPPEGLAIVLQCPLGIHFAQGLLKGASLDPNEAYRVVLSNAHDDHKFNLLRPAGHDYNYLFPQEDGLADVNGMIPNAYTFYLLPPPPGAHFFRFTLHITHYSTEQEVHVTFPSLALPQTIAQSHAMD